MDRIWTPVVSSSSSTQRSFFLRETIPLEANLNHFWEVQPEQCSTLTLEQQECEQHFLNNTHYQENGRFMVRPPLKEDSSQLGKSRRLAAPPAPHVAAPPAPHCSTACTPLQHSLHPIAAQPAPLQHRLHPCSIACTTLQHRLHHTAASSAHIAAPPAPHCSIACTTRSSTACTTRRQRCEESGSSQRREGK